MKKLLMLILIVLLLALSVFVVINGLEIGSIEVLSYTGIQKNNKELDEKIQEASKLAEKDYKEAVAMVQENSKKLENTKKEYDDMIAVEGDGSIQNTSQIERYEVETLWVKLGKYATSEGAIIKMDILQGNTSDTYNLMFTVNGSYVSITDFISDIENDSTLGFKIEEFKMLPGETADELQATFVCKEIGIKDISNANSNIMQNQPMDGTTNPSNPTNTTTTTNQTNSTNTVNKTETNTTTNGTNTQNTTKTTTNTKKDVTDEYLQ